MADYFGRKITQLKKTVENYLLPLEYAVSGDYINGGVETNDLFGIPLTSYYPLEATVYNPDGTKKTITGVIGNKRLAQLLGTTVTKAERDRQKASRDAKKTKKPAVVVQEQAQEQTPIIDDFGPPPQPESKVKENSFNIWMTKWGTPTQRSMFSTSLNFFGEKVGFTIGKYANGNGWLSMKVKGGTWTQVLEFAAGNDNKAYAEAFEIWYRYQTEVQSVN